MNIELLVQMISSNDNQSHDLVKTYISTFSIEDKITLRNKLFDMICNGGYPFESKLYGSHYKGYKYKLCDYSITLEVRLSDSLLSITYSNKSLSLNKIEYIFDDVYLKYRKEFKKITKDILTIICNI
jgi:hypothetical protein